MRTSPLWMGIALVLAGPLACEPAAPPVVPVAPATPAVATGVAVVQPPAYDLAPVAEPNDVVGLVRWKSASIDLTNLSSCTNIAGAILDQVPRIGLTKALEKSYRDQIDAAELAGLVALDAPVDAVVTLDSSRTPKPVFAFAVGLTSLEGAKHAASAKGLISEIVPGVWRIGEKDRHGFNCAIVVSAGATPARLVCAEKEKDLTALAPYLTRTLPTLAPAASDFHAELRITPLDTRFGDQLRQQLRGLPILAQTQATIGEPDFDNAVMASATALTDELGAFVGDLDKLQIDATLDKGTCLTSTTALQMRGKSSWIVNTMMERADHVGPPPAIFWRAPRDASSVFYGHGADPSRYTEILRTLRTMLVGAMKKLAIGSDDDRKALADLIVTPLGKDINTMSSSGHSGAPAAKPGAKPAAAKPAAGARTGASAKIVSTVENLGWYVMGFDDGAEALQKQLKDLVAVYNRKGLHDPLKKALGKDAAFLPTVKVVAAPASLGKDALDIEVKLDIPDDEPWAPSPEVLEDQRGNGGKPAKPVKPIKPVAKGKTTLTLHLLLAIDGKTAWFGFGGNRDDVVKHILMSKSGSPDTDTIASRPGLETLKNGKNLSGGFFTLNTFLKAIENAMDGTLSQKPSELAEAKRIMSQLPNRGDTPIFLTTTSTGGATPRGEMKVEMTKGSFEDIGSMVNQALGPILRGNP